MPTRGINSKPEGATHTNFELWLEHFRQRAIHRAMPDVLAADIVRKRAKQLAEKGPPNDWRAMDGLLTARELRNHEIPAGIFNLLKGALPFMLTKFVGSKWRAVAVAVAGVAVALAALDVTSPAVDNVLNGLAVVLAAAFGFDLAVARDKDAKKNGS